MILKLTYHEPYMRLTYEADHIWGWLDLSRNARLIGGQLHCWKIQLLMKYTIWHWMTTCEHYMIFFLIKNLYLSHRDQSNTHHPQNSEMSFIWLGVKRVGKKVKSSRLRFFFWKLASSSRIRVMTQPQKRPSTNKGRILIFTLKMISNYQ